MGQTHDEKSFKKSFTQLEDIDALVKILNEREKKAEKYVSEEEAPKSDDLSVLYAAYAMQSPKAQQVVERAEDVSLDSDVRVSPDPEAVREHSYTGEVTIGDVVAGHVRMGEGLYEVLDNGALAFVHEELTEEQQLEVVREVQKAPLL